METKTKIVIKSKREGKIKSIQSVKTKGYHICGLIHKRIHGDQILRALFRQAAVSEDYYGNIIFPRRR